MSIDSLDSNVEISPPTSVFFQALLDQLDNLVFVKDEEGKFVYVNQAFADFIGSPVHEYIGRTAPEIFESEDHFLKAQSQDYEVLNQEDGFTIQEDHTYAARPGSEMRLTKRKFSMDGQAFLIGTLVDISDLKFTEKRLRQSNLELETKVNRLEKTEIKLIESEKMATVGHLTAGLAHEIGNPINYVAGNVIPLKKDFEELYILLQEVRNYKKGQPIDQLMDRLTSDFMQSNLEEINSLLEGIEEGSDRVKSLLSSLKAFTKTSDCGASDVDINNVINNTLKLIEHKIAAGVSIGTELDPQLPTLYTDTGQLAQVILHMLNNALAAIKGYGRVILRTSQVDDRILIQIEDDGVGIAESLQEKIFEPFFTTREVGNGTGLGLSICLSIVNRLGGSIELKSKVNEGTTIVVNLPIE